MAATAIRPLTRPYYTNIAIVCDVILRLTWRSSFQATPADLTTAMPKAVPPVSIQGGVMKTCVAVLVVTVGIDAATETATENCG